jgi:hypothetical protein
MTGDGGAGDGALISRSRNNNDTTPRGIVQYFFQLALAVW